MKYLTRHRPVTILLCLTLGLLLTACGGQSEPSPAEGSSSLAGALVGGKRSMVSESAQTTDPEKGAAALALLRESMAGEDQLAGAVAYLGHREQGEALPLTSWLEKIFPDLTEELPFLLEIPAERTLGPGYGDLYCIIPRDERTSLAVNHVTWQSQGNGVWPVADEVLYREEYAQPVLVFVNYETWPDEPDTEIGLVTNSGLEVKWYPMTDPSGSPIVPTGVDYAPMLMDIGVFSENIGPDDPENQEPTGDDWWLPPTDVGLGNTVWVCDGWLMELRQGGGAPIMRGPPSCTSPSKTRRRWRWPTPACGAWRMTACGWRSPTASAPPSTAAFRSSFPPPARRCISSARAAAKGRPSCRTTWTPSG